MPDSSPHRDAAAVADLAPTGLLRATINNGNPALAAKDPASGQEVRFLVDLPRELARRLGVAIAFVPDDAAGKVVQGADAASFGCNADFDRPGQRRCLRVTASKARRWRRVGRPDDANPHQATVFRPARHSTKANSSARSSSIDSSRSMKR